MSNWWWKSEPNTFFIKAFKSVTKITMKKINKDAAKIEINLHINEFVRDRDVQALLTQRQMIIGFLNSDSSRICSFCHVVKTIVTPGITQDDQIILITTSSD